jgi:prepilin-type N-terminal cleavage/methylation domain-containing protein
MQISSIKNKNAGFTLIESMIAIALIVSGITGLMVLVNRSMGFANLAFNQLTAANLAQEGIELVRNIRDNNWMNKKNWLTGLNVGTYQIDYLDGKLIDFSEREEQTLFFDEDNGYSYIYASGGETFYYRKIELTLINDNELRVKSIIIWSAKGGKNFETIAEDHLFNWL